MNTNSRTAKAAREESVRKFKRGRGRKERGRVTGRERRRTKRRRKKVVVEV